MPKIKKKKSNRGLLPHEVMKLAAEEVLSGSPLRFVAKRFGITKSTLQRKAQKLKDNKDAQLVGRSPSSITMGKNKHKKHKSDNRLDDDGGGDYSQEKPLKLVLNIKVGSGQGQDSEAVPPYSDERKHKHKKKKKKKSGREKTDYSEENSLKRPLEEDDDESEEDEDDEEEEQEKDDYNDVEDYSDGSASPNRRLREPRSCSVRDDDKTILKMMLNYLLKNLQNKDVNGFFAFPVTDNIAPGYSLIIRNPMDFSTMAEKIESGDYINVMEFRKDFNLMCNNAMTYNRPDTIYYKEAKRLQHLGIRQLSKEKLLHLKKTQSFLTSISLRDLGFDESGQIVERSAAPPIEQPIAKVKLEQRLEPEPVMRNCGGATEEEASPAEILAQATLQAEKARHALTTRRPKTDLGFLRQEDDGTTSMTILNPWNDGIVSSTQKVINLGDYMGRLKNGSGSLFKFKEDKRNNVCPETYLCYGPFSSHAPSYDSSFSSCSKEESDLLLSTYEGEIGVQYAKSVQKFIENAGLSAVEMVDKLLDTLTDKKHSQSQQLQEEQKRREEKQAEKALQDEMIAIAEKAAEEAERRDPVQHKLNETAAYLSELSQTQNERLSQDPPANLNLLPQPSDKEADLAHKVTDNLMSMTKQVYPRDVVSTPAVRNAMGISTQLPGDPPRNGVAVRRPPVTVDNSSEEDSEEDESEDDSDSVDGDPRNLGVDGVKVPRPEVDMDVAR